MVHIFHDTAAGQIIRFISRNKLLQYPEELPGFTFQYPASQSLKTSEPGTLQIPLALDPTNVQDPENAQTKEDTFSSTSANTKLPDSFVLVGWYTPGL